MVGPLEGTRVLVLAGMGPVPYLSMLLADMGADVVRILRPADDPDRAIRQTAALKPEQDVVNRGVDSMVADLHDAATHSRVVALACAADVFIEGHRPGVAERLGLGPDVLLARNERLVYARVTGYGQTGPRAHDAGHDINYVAQSGALHAMARLGEQPRPPINPLADYAGGGSLGAFGIACALLAVRRSGVGQVLDIAMLDGVASLTAKLHGLRAAGVYAGVAGTSFLDSGAPFYDTYLCADGRYIAVGASEPRFYREFVSRLGVELGDWPEQYDQSQGPRLRTLIASAVLQRSRDAWTDVFEGTDACVTGVLSFDEAALDVHNASRGVYQHVNGVVHPAPMPRFSGTPAREPAPPEVTPSPVSVVARRWQVAD